MTKTQTRSPKRVAVLGASQKEERYSNMALRMLKDKGHDVIPVHPRLKTIEGIPVAASLSEIRQPYHTLTLYVGPQKSEAMMSEILASKPKRVIMNPGAESERLKDALQGAGVEVVQGCTLVMLQTGYF